MQVAHLVYRLIPGAWNGGKKNLREAGGDAEAIFAVHLALAKAFAITVYAYMSLCMFLD